MSMSNGAGGDDQNSDPSEIKRLAGHLAALAEPSTGEPLTPEIAALARRLHEQIQRNNWLQADAPAATPDDKDT
jgi:hypothetical protein